MINRNCRDVPSARRQCATSNGTITSSGGRETILCSHSLIRMMKDAKIETEDHVTACLDQNNLLVLNTRLCIHHGWLRCGSHLEKKKVQNPKPRPP